jgi:hypothetical protein
MLICRYWWNQPEGKQKIHWISWEKLVKAKSEGLLGFRDIYALHGDAGQTGVADPAKS